MDSKGQMVLCCHTRELLVITDFCMFMLLTLLACLYITFRAAESLQGGHRENWANHTSFAFSKAKSSIYPQGYRLAAEPNVTRHDMELKNIFIGW